MACDLPEAEARHLLAELSGDNLDTYFVRQPKTAEEVEQAISATRVCCVDAVRYGGTDKTIIRRMEPHLSDYKISFIGSVVRANSPWWKLW